MRLKVSSLVIFIMICFSVVGCTQSNKINENQIGKELRNVLSMPDKIVIHYEGNIQELDKTNSQFKKIVELTNSRFHNKLTTAKDIIDDKVMESTYKDGLGIEFIYNNEQSLSIKEDGFQPFKYYKLYFLLTSKLYGNSQGSTVHIVQYGDKEHYKDCSRGPLKYSEELIETIHNLEF